jgi:hypothetical protein
MRKLIIIFLFNIREIEILNYLLHCELQRTRDKIFNRKYDTNINEEINYDTELCKLLNLFTEPK